MSDAQRARIDREMLRSMSAALSSGLPFSFNNQDMSDLLFRMSELADPKPRAAAQPAPVTVEDMPTDGSCRKCGCAPTNAESYCQTCVDERADAVEEAARVLLAQPYSIMAAAFDAMDAKQGEGADRIMSAALRALAGEKP